MAREIPEISSTLEWKDVSLPSSISETDLDAAILSTVKADWRKVAFVVGTVLRTLFNRGLQISDEIVAARIQELAKQGQIEGQGDLRKWRFSEVRHPLSSEC